MPRTPGTTRSRLRRNRHYLVIPNVAKPNLGGVAGELKANPTLWTFDLPANDVRNNGETLEGLIRHSWPSPDRHGGANKRPPTQSEAEAARDRCDPDSQSVSRPSDEVSHRMLEVVVEFRPVRPAIDGGRGRQPRRDPGPRSLRRLTRAGRRFLLFGRGDNSRSRWLVDPDRDHGVGVCLVEDLLPRARG